MDLVRRHWKKVVGGGVVAGIVYWLLSNRLVAPPRRRERKKALEVDSDVEKRFQEATSAVSQGLGGGMSDEHQLMLYGYFKQATVGPASEAGLAAPSLFDMVGQAMRDAWEKLGTMSAQAAMEEYVKIVKEYGGSGGGESANQAAKSWKATSKMLQEEEPIDEDQPRDILYFAREGLVDDVRQLLREDASRLMARDEDGVTPLLWACDRGHEALVTELLNAGAKVNETDGSGMTPLHYACMCSHVEIVKLLLARGAKADAQDSDGTTPVELADLPDIVELLNKM